MYETPQPRQPLMLYQYISHTSTTTDPHPSTNDYKLLAQELETSIPKYHINSGMADMEYSIMERGPVVAMCMKVDPEPRPGYGYCQLKPAIMVNDGKSNKSSYFLALNAH